MHKNIRWLLLLVLAFIPVLAFASDKFTLTSSSFSSGGRIPVKYTGQGQDISPQLSWRQVPAKTQSLALICRDPDAPGEEFIHWLAVGISSQATSLPEGIKANDKRLIQGTNDFSTIGYAGPNPPKGPAHRYYYELWALDYQPKLAPRFTLQQFRQATKHHILAKAQYMGRYASH